jgi:hypothetical protein
LETYIKRAITLIITLALIFLIVVCINKETNEESIKAGELILNQDKISNIKIQKFLEGSSFIKMRSQFDINEIIKMISDIPVRRLTKNQDIEYMQNGQKLKEEGFVLYFFDEDEVLQGQFMIWPDGNIYGVDINSMQNDQRTISYLSESTYPQIYKRIQDKKQE